jgi:RimJ/RimL family protein N-acetyltransferase
MVLLRPWIAEDAPTVFAACQDPEIGRWTNVPQPYLPEHAEGFIAHLIESWHSGTAAMLAIADAATGEMLGAPCGVGERGGILGRNLSSSKDVDADREIQRLDHHPHIQRARQRRPDHGRRP